MTMLLTADAMRARTAVALGPLHALATSLRDDLYQAIPTLDVWVPPEKARLSRYGGRCRADGALLSFRPDSPRAHTCPACGAVFREEEDYRWWIMNYQLWLAERAVHAATLAAVLQEPRCTSIARAILTACTEQYLTYPNNDNVLGPTRPFFSTYLESIWLLQLTVALDLIEWHTPDRALGDRVRADLIAPSAALIQAYDEHESNRQVWNNAALAASAVLLDDRRQLQSALAGPSGLQRHLDHALLSDGTWYEGENYHLFAHRGLWYGVQIAERAGHSLPAALLERFQSGFRAPFLTALPDLTFPARRDSQYGVSLRQWRIAESCELGLARQPDDETLRSALHALYHAPDELPLGDSGRATSTAEAERNHPGVQLSRSRLGWKSLLFASSELPPLGQAQPRTVLLPAQGLAVLRREEGNTYVALDYGHSGDGHGHPDRLNLWLVRGHHRVLEDVGTGSYTAPTLHWYRSTLAHNAPLIDGVSQDRVDGELLLFDDDQDLTTVSAVARIGVGVSVTRTLQVFPDAMVDTVEWTASRPVRFELPVHAQGVVSGVSRWLPATLGGGSAAEDGFGFVTASERADGLSSMVRIECEGGIIATVHAAGLECFRGTCPGPPGKAPRSLLLWRAFGQTGRIRAVWSWRLDPADVAFADDTVSIRAVDHTYQVRTRDGGWEVELQRGAVRRRAHHVGRQASPAPQPSTPQRIRKPITLHARAGGGERVSFELGESSYRRSELPWREAGAPRATVDVQADLAHVLIDVLVEKTSPWFSPSIAENPLDNEHPDTNSDGLQLYVGIGGTQAAWLLVPDVASRTMRVTPRAGPASAVPIVATWRQSPGMWEAHLALPRAALDDDGHTVFAFNLVVNESPGPPLRERRRGQLVLAGNGNEWVYLRGDREAAANALNFVIVDD